VQRPAHQAANQPQDGLLLHHLPRRCEEEHPTGMGGNRPGGERDKAKHDTKTATKAVRLGLIHKEAAWMKAAEEDYRAWKSKFKSSIP